MRMKDLLLESPEIGDSLDLIRRNLYPDIPHGNEVIEAHLLGELNHLLKIHLSLRHILRTQYFDETYLREEFDYDYPFGEECFNLFDQFLESRVYKTVPKFSIKDLDVRTTYGLIVISFK